MDNSLHEKLKAIENSLPEIEKQLSEIDIAAVITYTRQAWGNDSDGDGKIVVPKEIVEYKENKNNIEDTQQTNHLTIH